MNIDPERLAEAMNDLLEDYSDDVHALLQEAAEEVAAETVKELKATSPQKRGKYSKGWKVKVVQGVGHRSYVIHNDKHYRLTHLLEYGHATRNGGRAKAMPHIAKAEEAAIKAYERRVSDGIEKLS